jgi:aldose 1-epimerase
MVGCSLRHGGEELLHLRGGVAEYARTGSTLGIPLLHPWANRLAGFEYSADGRTVQLDPRSPLLSLEENGLPIHGLLGGSPHWKVRETTADDDGAALIAELDFGAHDDLLAAFPFPHLLRKEVRLQEGTLTIRTTVTATGDVDVPISFGYHPYLRLPGTPRDQWEIELPVRERLVLDDRMIPTGSTEPVSYPREPLGERSFDDAFAELEPDRPFAVGAAGRELSVTFLDGYPFAQVYSPRGEQFICYEPMTAPTNALLVGGPELPKVRPAESFTAAFGISVSET